MTGATGMWNGYTNSQTPQQFMDISREQGHTTIESAVKAYVDDITPDWAGEGLTVEQRMDVTHALIEHLQATEGTEWA